MVKFDKKLNKLEILDLTTNDKDEKGKQRNEKEEEEEVIIPWQSKNAIELKVFNQIKNNKNTTTSMESEKEAFLE